MDPILNVLTASTVDHIADDATVVTSNCSPPLPTHTTKARRRPSMAATARSIFGKPMPQYLNALTIAANKAIADTGATAIFILDNAKVDNKRIATKPLKINLPDGSTIWSTHVCDIQIPGLPQTLTGHIVPSLKIASLIGIRPLCKAGCKVVFDNEKCEVWYNGTVILAGEKDIATDLWTLPIPQGIMGTTQTSTPNVEEQTLSRPSPIRGRAPQAPPIPEIAMFTHSVTTRANAVKFAHQSLCNPKISSLLKATRRGYLKGCPGISETLILKYLNPSPATAKGHMKCPRHGIKSTRAREAPPAPEAPQPLPQINVPTIPIGQEVRAYPGPAYGRRHDPQWVRGREDSTQQPNLIRMDDDDATIANIFCFGAFADKTSGIVYNDLTGSFPFMSLEGSVCFFVLYHYESNCILASPIKGMDDKTIFKTYKKYFEELTSKGFKPKLNIMDNQATKHIKQFLTENDCKLQLVEPHNHRVNAAERAIQTFKDAFIAALATTDVDFPLQLWDKLTPQVQTCLNLMRRSRIDPSKSAHETLYGPYDWNRYPMAPLGCKAVVYEDGDTRGSWASRGVDGWYLGPSMDHYRCDLYYIPETRAYRISGSTELFPQHCQLPNLTPHQHFRALTDELTDATDIASATQKGRRLIKLLQENIKKILNPTDALEEQRVSDNETRMQQQRVIDSMPIITVPTVPRITNAQPILQSRNPTAKRTLKETPRVHSRVTRNNTPGGVPKIHREPTRAPDIRVSPRTKAGGTQNPAGTANAPNRRRLRNFAQQALNVLTTRELATADATFTPRALVPYVKTPQATCFEHYANPMVHPTTGETISSYKKLMNDPATAEVWQTAFGKDFGGMAQGCDKTGQKGTNAMFIMTRAEIAIALAAGKKFTYANPVVDHRPQKEDPNRIRITAGGNSSNVNQSYPSAQRTLTQQNYIGTVW